MSQGPEGQRAIADGVSQPDTRANGLFGCSVPLRLGGENSVLGEERFPEYGHVLRP
jgi:hypothetical protein